MVHSRVFDLRTILYFVFYTEPMSTCSYSYFCPPSPFVFILFLLAFIVLSIIFLLSAVVFALFLVDVFVVFSTSIHFLRTPTCHFFFLFLVVSVLSFLHIVLFLLVSLVMSMMFIIFMFLLFACLVYCLS